MQLFTERRRENGSDDAVKVGVKSILFQPLLITSYDIFPSQYRGGKEAIRLVGWTEIDGEFKEINVVTESKPLVRTLKDKPMLGETYETMIVKDPKTRRYLFSNITKDQQKNLINKFNEKRKQRLEQDISGLFGE